MHEIVMGRVASVAAVHRGVLLLASTCCSWFRRFFTLQVFDRVISSNSQETLLVLLAGTGIALLLLLLLDYVRNRLQNVLGNIIDERLSPPVVKAIVARTARMPHRRALGGHPRRGGAAQRVCGQRPGGGVRCAVGAGLCGGDLAVPSGAGDRCGGGGAADAGSGLAQRPGEPSALETLQKEGRRASQYVESSLRNAEVLQALGMTQRLLERWRTLAESGDGDANARQPQRGCLQRRHALRAPGDSGPDALAGRLPGAHAAGLGRRHDRHHASCWAGRCSRWSSWWRAGAA